MLGNIKSITKSSTLQRGTQHLMKFLTLKTADEQYGKSPKLGSAINASVFRFTSNYRTIVVEIRPKVLEKNR